MAEEAIPFSWKAVADSESPESASIAVDDGRATMLIDIDLTQTKADLQSCIAEILGYSWYNTARHSKLSRKVPWRHPVFTQLWASQAGNIRGRKFESKNWSALSGLAHSRYSHVRMEILYSAPPFSIMTDAEVDTHTGTATDAEFGRYLSHDVEVSCDAISRKGQQYRFAAASPVSSGGSAYPTGVTALQGFGDAVSRRLVKIRHTFTWHLLPANGLVDPKTHRLNTNITSCLGHVNTAVFPAFGTRKFPAGTLLFLTTKLKPRMSPVVNALISGGSPMAPLIYDLSFVFLEFDPPIDPDWSGAGVEYPYRGHNLAPTPTNSQYWYLITRDTAANSPAEASRNYPSAAFANLFKLP